MNIINYQIIQKRKEKENGVQLIIYCRRGHKMGFPSKDTILLPHTYTESRTKKKKKKDRRKTGKKKKKINGINKVTKNN